MGYISSASRTLENSRPVKQSFTWDPSKSDAVVLELQDGIMGLRGNAFPEAFGTGYRSIYLISLIIRCFPLDLK